MRRVIVCTASFLALLLVATYLYSAPIPSPFAGELRSSSGLATSQCPWEYARNRYASGYLDTNDSTPDANAMTWQDTGTYLPIPPEWNYLSMAFLCYGDGNGDGDANAGTFDVNVYVVDSYSSWDHVCSFTVTVGELEATHFPVHPGTEINGGNLDPNESYKWAEGEITPGEDYEWLSSVDYTGCTDGIGRCSFDSFGARVLVVLIDNKAHLTRIYPLVKGR